MACDLLIPAACAADLVAAVPAAVGDAAASAVGNQFAEAMADGAAWVLQTTVGWWVDVPAIDLVTSPATTIRGYVLWLSLLVATVGVMWQGVLLAVTRRPDPLMSIGRGLFTLTTFAALGIIGPAAALRAGDQFASWVLDEAGEGQAAQRLVAIADMSGISSAGAVILLGLLMMLSGLAQAVVMIFREGAVVVLAGVVVLAAAGSFANATRPWLHRVVGWMAALIAYKPIAALVYATALTMVGEGNDPRTLLVGLTMIVLAIFVLPALMKFFSWTTGAATSGSSGHAAMALGAGASAIHAAGAWGGGGSASTQAANIRQDLGPPTGAAPAGAPSGAGAAPAMAGTNPSAPVGRTAANDASSPGAAGTAASGTAAAGTAAAAGPAGAAVVAGAVAVDAAQRAAAAAQHHLTNGSDP